MIDMRPRGLQFWGMGDGEIGEKRDGWEEMHEKREGGEYRMKGCGEGERRRREREKGKRREREREEEREWHDKTVLLSSPGESR